MDVLLPRAGAEETFEEQLLSDPTTRLVELAAMLDVSSRAVGGRIRPGTVELVRATLLGEE